MNCYTSSFIGLAMLGATFLTMTVGNETKQGLINTLSPELEDKYRNIVGERRFLYFQGLIIGILVVYFLQRKITFKNMYHRGVFTLAVVMPISAIYYFFMPKSDYMVGHLKTVEQNHAWMQVYKTMKMKYTIGFILGSLASIPIAYSFCK